MGTKRRNRGEKGGELGNGDRGRRENIGTMKDRVKDGQVVVKEMNWREIIFSYGQLTLQMCIKMKYTQRPERERERERAHLEPTDSQPHFVYVYIITLQLE